MTNHKQNEYTTYTRWAPNPVATQPNYYIQQTVRMHIASSDHTNREANPLNVYTQLPNPNNKIR